MEQKHLREKVDSLPEAPGVYIYKDVSGKIIYIGKAKSLKKRVQSYFTRYLTAKTQALVSRIADIEYILSPTEVQAALLEATLIKEKQPQYNISLKDDKSFPLIKITEEEYPVISICRARESARERQRCQYLGPYVNAKLLRRALKVIRSIFGFRSCARMPERACLYYRMKLCPGPCVGAVSPQQYRELVNDIRLFLESRYEELLDQLSRKMSAASARKEFEEAARIRDQILALSIIGGKRHFASADELKDLSQLARLKELPRRIEGFDISNVSGKEATGSMVSFFNGYPDKKNYRRFRIKSVNAVDDYAMLEEVVGRRYRRLTEEKKPLPDLVLIDGGRQHLAVAERALRKLGLSVPVISIAKEEENIYRSAMDGAIRNTQDRPGLNLVRRVRDEAHRFARAYHHLLHKKKILGQK
jgi:excinuclease ABC subunit C